MKSFCVVCIANFCRSPVFEKILRNIYGNKYTFISAGLSPIYQASMDKRSYEFLKNIDIKPGIHTPKRLSEKILTNYDVIYAVDIIVLNLLNKKFPKHRNKFKLISAQFKNIDIIDPYKLEENDYLNLMKDIKFVCENINLEI